MILRTIRARSARQCGARAFILLCIALLVACGGPAPATTTGQGTAAPTATGAATATAPAVGSPTAARTPVASAAATATRATATAGATATPFGLAPGQGSPIDGVALTTPLTITLWHAQPTGVREQELRRIIDGFQAQYPGITVKAEYQGSALFNKVRAAASGGGLPDLATATESQVSEYRAGGLVVPLEDYVRSARYGLTAADLADFYPAYIAANQYREHGGQLLALPFAKSVLGLYYNGDKLREAGLSVPTTWDEFAAACKRFTGDTKGYAVGISASAFMAAVYSRGGRLLDEGQAAWRFNEGAGQDQLALLQELIASGCAYQVEKQFADQSDFGAGRAVFTIDASSGFSYYRDLVAQGGRFDWGIAALPHATSAAPATTLSGSNLAVLASTPERQLAAWLFVRYATSRDATATWAAATGYLPVRQSALGTAPMQRQFAELPAYRLAATELPLVARPEPALRGGTETRQFIEEAMVAAISDPRRSPKDLLDEAVRRGNAALQQR